MPSSSNIGAVDRVSMYHNCWTISLVCYTLPVTPPTTGHHPQLINASIAAAAAYTASNRALPIQPSITDQRGLISIHWRVLAVWGAGCFALALVFLCS